MHGGHRPVIRKADAGGRPRVASTPPARDCPSPISIRAYVTYGTTVKVSLDQLGRRKEEDMAKRKAAKRKTARGKAATTRRKAGRTRSAGKRTASVRKSA